MAFNVGIIGQSNAARWVTDPDPGPAYTPAVNVELWGGASFAVPTTGNGQISFGNQLAVAVSDTVNMVNSAAGSTALLEKAGSGVGYWYDPNTTSPVPLYQNFKDDVTASAVTLDAIVWIQGEADANNGTVSSEEYSAGMVLFFAQIRADFGNIPIVVMGLARTTAGGKEYGWPQIRQGQKDGAAQINNCELSATSYDLDLVDTLHLTPTAYIEHGTRAFLTLQLLLGNLSYNKGPQITGVDSVSATQTRVNIAQVAGTDFTPSADITGFTVSNSLSGGNATISAVDRETSTSILITHSDLSGTGVRKVTYLDGPNPDVSDPVYGDGTYTLPLEWAAEVKNMATGQFGYINDVPATYLTDRNVGGGVQKTFPRIYTFKRSSGLGTVPPAGTIIDKLYFPMYRTGGSLREVTAEVYKFDPDIEQGSFGLGSPTDLAGFSASTEVPQAADITLAEVVEFVLLTPVVCDGISDYIGCVNGNAVDTSVKIVYSGASGAAVDRTVNSGEGALDTHPATFTIDGTSSELQYGWADYTLPSDPAINALTRNNILQSIVTKLGG